jgi:integrase
MQALSARRKVHDIAASARLEEIRPCLHERSPFFERVAPPVGPLRRVADDNEASAASATSRGKCVSLPAQSRNADRKPCTVTLSSPIRRRTISIAMTESGRPAPEPGDTKSPVRARLASPTWIAQYRVGSKQRRLSLGSTETLDAEEARRRARSALSKVNLGADPQTEKANARIKASVTIGATVGTYLSRREAHLKANHFDDVRRYLRVHWAPLHEVAVHSVTRSMVAARLAEIATGNGLYAANRARAALSAFYSWAIGEGLADENPVVGTNKPVDEISRDRVLNPDELRLAWRLAGGADFGAIVRLLILTGQRREEVGGMLWSELDLDAALWTIGKDRWRFLEVSGRPRETACASLIPTTRRIVRSVREDRRNDEPPINSEV